MTDENCGYGRGLLAIGPTRRQVGVAPGLQVPLVLMDEVDLERGVSRQHLGDADRGADDVRQAEVVAGQVDGPAARGADVVLQRAAAEHGGLVGIELQQVGIGHLGGELVAHHVAADVEPRPVPPRVQPQAAAHDRAAVATHVPGEAEARLQVVEVVAAVGGHHVLEPGELRIGQQVADQVGAAQVAVEVVAQPEVESEVAQAQVVLGEEAPLDVLVVPGRRAAAQREPERPGGPVGLVEIPVGVELPHPGAVVVGEVVEVLHRHADPELGGVAAGRPEEGVVEGVALAREALRQVGRTARGERRADHLGRRSWSGSAGCPDPCTGSWRCSAPTGRASSSSWPTTSWKSRAVFSASS